MRIFLPDGAFLPCDHGLDFDIAYARTQSVLVFFSTFSVLVANPKKILYTVANPARGLLYRGEGGKSGSAPPPSPPPPARCSFGENKIKIT